MKIFEFWHSIICNVDSELLFKSASYLIHIHSIFDVLIGNAINKKLHLILEAFTNFPPTVMGNNSGSSSTKAERLNLILVSYSKLLLRRYFYHLIQDVVHIKNQILFDVLSLSMNQFFLFFEVRHHHLLLSNLSEIHHL